MTEELTKDISLAEASNKLNFESTMLPNEGAAGVGLPTNGSSINPSFGTQGGIKRRRTEEYSEMGIYSSKLNNYVCSETRSYAPARTFLCIRHNAYTYHTEDWKPRGSTMYSPLTEDIMINTRNIEQISFESDQFFLADRKGNYVGAKSGNAIHLWRFDNTSRKLYISRSFLFLKEQDYHDVQVQLDNL